jgi:hypothetical protein
LIIDFNGYNCKTSVVHYNLGIHYYIDEWSFGFLDSNVDPLECDVIWLYYTI